MKGNKQIELKAQRYLYERAHLSGSCVVTTFDPFDLEQAFIDGAEWQLNHPTYDYAWKIYNFILDYTNGKFGEDLTLQQAIDKYFKDWKQND